MGADTYMYSATHKETGKCGFSHFGQYLSHTACNLLQIKTGMFYYLYRLSGTNIKGAGDIHVRLLAVLWRSFQKTVRLIISVRLRVKE